MNAAFHQPVDAAVVPRFAGFSTFMRLPAVTSAAGLDIALVGIPWDGGTTNRAGARHGPREMRNQSSLMRRVHHVTRMEPFSVANIADVGDVSVNPIDLRDGLARIEASLSEIVAAGAIPLCAGGDHLTTLPVLRAVAKSRPVGLIHFDAHSDTNDTYFGDNPFTHGTPFRRAIEEGLGQPHHVAPAQRHGDGRGLDGGGAIVPRVEHGPQHLGSEPEVGEGGRRRLVGGWGRRLGGRLGGSGHGRAS